MKHVLIVIGFMLSSHFSFSQWYYQSSLSIEKPKMYFTDSYKGFVVGNQSGDFFIYRTLDGGNTWDTTNLSANTLMQDISGISFISKDTGFISIVTGANYFTYDGGNSWNKISSSPGITFQSISFINSQVGLGCIQHCSKTTDGGKNWTLIQGVYGDQVQFIDDSTGFLVNHNGIFVTSDLGSTWEERPFNNPFMAYNTISFRNRDFGVVAGKGLGKTTDGGLTWKSIPVPEVNFFTAVQMVSDSTGYAAGFSMENHLYKTTDAGDNWYKQKAIGPGLSRYNFFDLNCPSADTCYAITQNGLFYKTTNGGGEMIDYGVGVEDINQKQFFKIYPNPSEGIVNVEFTSVSSNSLIEVYDLLGSRKTAVPVDGVGEIKEKIDISAFPKGMYIVIVSDGEKRFSQKIISK